MVVLGVEYVGQEGSQDWVAPSEQVTSEGLPILWPHLVDCRGWRPSGSGYQRSQFPCFQAHMAQQRVEDVLIRWCHLYGRRESFDLLVVPWEDRVWHDGVEWRRFGAGWWGDRAGLPCLWGPWEGEWRISLDDERERLLRTFRALPGRFDFSALRDSTLGGLLARWRRQVGESHLLDRLPIRDRLQAGGLAWVSSGEGWWFPVNRRPGLTIPALWREHTRSDEWVSAVPQDWMGLRGIPAKWKAPSMLQDPDLSTLGKLTRAALDRLLQQGAGKQAATMRESLDSAREALKIVRESQLTIDRLLGGE